MNAAELKEKTKRILSQKNSLHLYLVLETDDGFMLRLADLQDDETTAGALKKMFGDRLYTDIVNNEELTIISISADEKDADAIVSFDVDKHPDELDPFITFDSSIRITDRVVFNFSNDSLNDIRGFIIEIGNQDASIVLYKKHYPMMLMRRDLLLGVYKSKERFEKLPEADVLKISGSFQLLRIGNDCFVTDRKMLDQIMSDEVFRQDRIKESIEAIKSLNVIEDIDQLAAEGDATITRKLFCIATNSPVIKKGITAERLIKYTQTTGIFNNRFHYSEDGKRIRLDTKASRIAFLKLLNDAFLRSELTNDYYEARAKEKMD